MSDYATWRVDHADCVEAMAAMDEASVDAVVTDPPYGLEFMGKEWDRLGALTEEVTDTANRDGNWTSKPFGGGGQRVRYGSSARSMQAWHEAWATEALRVLKPGGHLLAFGGTRTSHRLVCAIEDAGFEIRDTICWLYGSGFPKSLDVSKAIDKAAGAKRAVIGMAKGAGTQNTESLGPYAATYAATPDAERWEGWGTALKPAHEPIVVARKPLTGTVAANVLEHGTGALNVDGCRVETEQGASLNGGRVSSVTEGWDRPWKHHAKAVAASHARGAESVAKAEAMGRWPANVILDPEAAAALDAQTGELTSGSRAEGVRKGLGYHGANGDGGPAIEGDTGGASRFFYVAKASSAERNAGLDEFAARPAGNFEDDAYEWATDGRGNPRTAPIRKANTHPTVKPIELMQWLVRLVTPPGGTVLDPFTGSGTTGIAAVREGFEFVGIEREAEYAAIARARIAWWAAQPRDCDRDRLLAGDKGRKATAETGQASMFDVPGAREAA